MRNMFAINQFHAIGFFVYPLKLSGNLLFSDVFRGTEKKTSGMKWVNGLTSNKTVDLTDIENEP